MKTLLRRFAGVTTAMALATAGLAGGQAGAATTNPCPSTPTTCPAYEPDAVNENGTVNFYDANGVQVTGGSINDLPSAAYAVASTDDQTASNYKATFYGYAANSGAKSPADFSGEPLSSSTVFPPKNAPANIAALGTHRPVVWLAQPVSQNGQTVPAQSESFATLAAHFPNGSDAKYANIYQLRIQTYGEATWWAADIQINPTAKTWQQIYPEVPQKTATQVSLSASPASSYAGQSVTFTATVSPIAAAGTVQFAVDGTKVGNPVPVSNGQATYTTSSLRSGGGQRTIDASFTPTDATTYSTSAAMPLRYTVKGAPFITAGPAIQGSARVGNTVTCFAGSDDSSASHSTAWFLNGGQVGTGDNYGIGEGDYLKALTCAVTFTNPAGSTTQASDAQNVGVGPALRVRTAPKIVGALVSGKRLSVRAGSFTPAATAYAYQWFLNGRAVRGATRTYFTVPKRSRGKVVSVRFTAKRYGWSNGAVIVRAKIRK